MTAAMEVFITKRSKANFSLSFQDVLRFIISLLKTRLQGFAVRNKHVRAPLQKLSRSLLPRQLSLLLLIVVNFSRRLSSRGLLTSNN